MTTFPIQCYDSIEEFAADYFANFAAAISRMKLPELAKAAALLDEAMEQGRWIYVCGNGGSAAIANHMLCDHIKGTQTDTTLKPRVVSLSAHGELITAIANDISYDDVFAYQLRTLARPGDVVMTISSSGNSENIVRTIAWAKENGVKSISLTGFSGGRSAQLADINVHVDTDNYGVIEDVHQSIMHILAQFIRMRRMDPALVAPRKF